MESEDWEALRERAAAVVSDVQGALGADDGANVEWFHISADRATASPYRVNQTAKAVGLNRDIVEGWLRELPGREADERFTALALRAAAALFFAPPAYRWKEAAELRIRSEQVQGLDESFAWAFAAASQILENHRLDQRVLELIPDAGIRLAQLVRFDLEAHPAFDIYPRAAIIMGRPNLPSDLAQPAFDAFVDIFGVDEADELASILNKYVSFKPDAIDEMVDATASLIFQAFPEAMGLWRGGGDQSEDLTSEDLWPFQGKLPEDGAIGWDDLERFVALTLPRFTGAAGLDFGDVLLIGLDGEAVTGRRIGAWSRSGAIYLDLTLTEFENDAVRELLARGWEQFRNAPESLFKSARAGEADQVAAEVIWILRDLAALPSTGGLTLWGRGPAEIAAQELGWGLKSIDPAGYLDPLVAHPSDHEDLARLVRSSLRVGNRTRSWDDALQFATTYLCSGRAGWAYPAYDGYMNEDATGPLTDADLLAPVLLNVSHLSVATFYRLQDEMPRLQKLLDQLSPDISLVDATPADLELIGALFEGIDAGRLSGARATTLSKILHRKRPALIPLQDTQVRRCYQAGDDAPLPIVPRRTWQAFTTELARQIQHDLASQHASFVRLADLAPGAPVTPLRAFDIIASRGAPLWQDATKA